MLITYTHNTGWMTPAYRLGQHQDQNRPINRGLNQQQTSPPSSKHAHATIMRIGCESP